MKKQTATAFLFFYVAFTFLFQVERTLEWAAQSEGAVSHQAAIEAQTQHPKQTRIAESGFVLHPFESANALPEIVSDISPLPLERFPVPTRRNIRPRSPPIALRIT